jgi:hypothetical protein
MCACSKIDFAERRVALAQLAEHADERVLREILAVPHVARQPTAVAVEHPAVLRQAIDVLPPGSRAERSAPNPLATFVMLCRSYTCKDKSRRLEDT